MVEGTDDKWEGRWDRLRGKAREHFGKLTDDDLEQAKGKRENLVGRIQEKYGETRETVELWLKEFEQKHL
ncbi:CsbD family protein [Salinisphaera sp. Q1T1-3]|uniref:CsbD family protein n=1 Tax=Salinisphaera sp. Q1T1-3 TaxID=2321229 RepID=UPI000E74309C|nr:CsbD family protein [Salinisphaera sp. Q1T1-3]RJS92572.1 CsbD family protein [Salinisphaera sp. Q1T1-3]